MTGTSGEVQHTFLIISHSFFLRMRNVSDKSCRENQKTHFLFGKYFFRNRTVYEIMWKNILVLKLSPCSKCKLFLFG